MALLVKLPLDRTTGKRLKFITSVLGLLFLNFVFLSSIKSGMSEKDKELDSLLKSIAKEPSSTVHANEAINDSNSIKYCVFVYYLKILFLII